ncbi:CoA-acylating methylmalonate-semialdehyde dehydrogenase, partial [Nocardia sp. NPDC055029]
MPIVLPWYQLIGHPTIGSPFNCASRCTDPTTRTGMVRELTHFIDGQHVKGASGAFGDVFDPNT